MSRQYEGELVRALCDAGWATMRAPTSGSATDRDLPDIIALNAERDAAWAIEHKSGSGTTLYVDADEVEQLRRYAAAAGAIPLLCARFTTQATPTTHFLLPPADARQTDGGNYGLPASDIHERASALVRPETTVQDPEVDIR